MRDEAKTSRHYSDLLSALAMDVGLDPSSISDRPSISNERSVTDFDWIENGLVAETIKGIWLNSKDEYMGHADEPVKIGTWGVSCQYMLAAETLGEVFRLGNQILNYLPPYSMQLSHEINNGRCHVEISCYQGEKDPHRFLSEFIAVTWHRFPCWLIDQYIPLQEVRFNYTEPSHSWIYEELFQCPIHFGQGTLGFCFDARLLSQKVVRNRTQLQEWLKDSPADLLYLPRRDSTITSQVRLKLDSSLRE